MKQRPVTHKTNCQLETISGQYARIESKKYRGSQIHKLVAKKEPTNASKVTFYKYLENNDHVYVTFSFDHGNKKYFPVEKEYSGSQKVPESPAPIEVKPRDPSNEKPEDRLLFKWTERKGDFQCLQTVAEPSQYLFVREQVFTLSSTSKTHFKVN